MEDKYRVVVTLKSGAFLEGETRAPSRPLEEVQQDLGQNLTISKTFSLTLADGTFAIIFTDNIEQVRLEKADA